MSDKARFGDENERLHWFLGKWREAERRWKTEREDLRAENQQLKEYSANLQNRLIREKSRETKS